MATPAIPTIYKHTDHPDWGRGVVLPREAGRADRLDLSFEVGGRRTILERFAAKLTPVPMSGDEAANLANKLANRRSKAAPSVIGRKKKPKASATETFATFDAQLKHFEAAYPGGFTGEKFSKEERGIPGGKRTKNDKTAALTDAETTLGEAAFKAGDVDALFTAATDLVRNTSFVHPLEGAATLAKMQPENRKAFVAALGEWLHGKGDQNARFEKFVASIKLEGPDGAAKRPSWPLVTLFAALVHPTEHVCVKPTFFQKQAVTMRVLVDYQPTPSAETYQQFLAMTHLTEGALKKAGQAPRDLVDVSSFICVSQGARTAVVEGKA